MGKDQIVIAKMPFTANQSIQDGGQYEFVVPRAELRFFDAASGKRIPARPV
jgi:hypothetical protein